MVIVHGNSSVVRFLLGEPLREQIWFRFKGIHPSQSADRQLLESEIVPWVGQTGAKNTLSSGFAVTRGIIRLSFPAMPRLCGPSTSTGNPPLWRSGPACGCRWMTASSGLFDAQMDAVIFSGVLGYGVDTRACGQKALANLGNWMPDRGILVVGWNTDRIADPVLDPHCPLDAMGYRWSGRRSLPIPPMSTIFRQKPRRAPRDWLKTGCDPRFAQRVKRATQAAAVSVLEMAWRAPADDCRTADAVDRIGARPTRV